MADREVSWKAVADFASLMAQSKKAKESLENLREEENKLAATFEADSARIAAASKTQNAAINDTSKSFDGASKASKDNANNVVRDSKRKQASYNNELAALNKVDRAHRELDVSSKKNADMGQRLYTIQQALAAASTDVARAEQQVDRARTASEPNLKNIVKSEQDLINARKSSQRITSAQAAAENERKKAIQEAEQEEKKAAQTAAALATARANSARASRETEASLVRTTRATRDETSAVTASTGATRQSEAETVRDTNVKKTFLQVLQNVQNLQKTYKGTVDSVAAAQQNHARALSRSLAATKELQGAENDLNTATQVRASSAAQQADAETRLGAARDILSHATEDVNRAEGDLTAVRARSGSGSREAVAAEQNLTSARNSYIRVSSTVSSIEHEVNTARQAGAQANRVIENSESRIANARQRATSAAGILTRAQTRLNGEMNASQSLTRQVGNAFQSLQTIFSGATDGFKDLVGLFGKMALTLLPQLIPLIGSLAGGITALASSFGPLVGFAGALPSLLLGAVTGFTAIKGAFSGVSGALKAYNTQQAAAAVNGTKAADTAKKNAKAIADAQRAVSDAKKNAAESDKEAAQRVTKAEQDATEANQQAAADVKKAEANKVKAFKDAADGVSKAVGQARDSVTAANENVVEAEKNLSSAQEDSKKAQQALNDVRKDAIQELEDMQKAARDASFSERDATLDLIDARNKLAEVKEDPKSSDSELQRAQLQYEEAQARLSDAEEAKKKANEDNATAQAKGIKGTKAYATAQDAAAAAAEKVAEAQTELIKSQKEQTKAVQDAAKSIAAAESDAADKRKSAAEAVTEAQKQQAKTQKSGLESIASAQQAQAKTQAQGAESIRKAEESVASAMDTASQATGAATKQANAYQAALAKLTPAQRQFVQFLIGLKPKLDQLRQTAGTNLLPGLEAGIRNVLPLFPTFNRSVGSTAKSIGDAAANIGKTLGSGEGFGAMQRVLKTNDDAFKTATGASGHYTLALTRIMDAARPLVSWIGSLVAEFGQYVDKTTAVNKKNGDLTRFFAQTKKEAQLFGGIIKNLGGIIYGIGRAAKPAGDTLWGNFGRHLKDLNKDLNSASGQTRLKNWFQKITPIMQSAGRIFTQIGRSISYLSGLGKDKGGKTGGLANLQYMLDQIANGVGPNSPLIQFFAKLNKSKGQKQTFDALGKLFTAVLDFGNGGGGNVLGIMATELDLVSKALGAIAGNKVGAAILTGLLTVAATAKVAKFVGAASGVTGTARVVRGTIQRVRARRGTSTPTSTGTGTGVPGATASAAEAEAQGNSIGRNLDSGIAAGVRSDNAEVMRAVDAMTDGIITNIRRNLEIHSPSKVTTRLGEQTAQGFINGLRGENKQASAAAESLETATIKAMSDTDEKMRLQGKEAGLAYAQGLKSTSKNAAVAAPGVVAGGGAPKSGRGAAVRGAVGGAGTAAFAGSMFLPGKAGEVAGEAGMALMLVSMLPSLKAVTGVIKSITAAMKLQKVAQIASAAAAKAYAAAQWLVNIALDANPIGLIIIGLVALGVAFYVLWTKSATFRKIVTGAFDAIKTAAVAVFNWFKNIGSTMFDGLKNAATSVFNWLKKNWPLILAILTAPFGGMQVYLTIKFWPQITGFLNKLWGWIKGAFGKLWSGVKAVLLAPFNSAKFLINQFTDSKSGVRKILSTLGSWVKSAFAKVWSGVKAVLLAPFTAAKILINQFTDSKSGTRHILSALWSWMTGAFRKIWSGVKAIFLAPFTAAKLLINQFTDSKSGVRHILSVLWAWISGTFKRTFAGIKRIFTDPIGAAKTAISTILGKTGLQKVFSGALAAISRIWRGLKKIVSDPIDAVINVINNPFIKGFNNIVGKLGSVGKKLKIPTIPNVGGKADGGLIGRAAGGVITGPWKGSRADNVLGLSDSGVPTARVNPGEYITRVSATQKMQRKHPGVLEYINRHGELPRHAEGGEIAGVVSTVKYALSKVGGPYVWGAAGPHAFDCSGLTSASWRHGTGEVIPHLAQAQHDNTGIPVHSRGNLIPGDLVFPRMGSRGQIPHVEMYVGNGQVVEAMNPKLGIRGPHAMNGFAGGGVRPFSSLGSIDAKSSGGGGVGGIMDAIGGALISAAKRGGSILGSVGGAMLNPLKGIINGPLEKAMSKFPGSSFAQQVLPAEAKNLVSGVIDWGKNKLTSLLSMFGGGSGGGPGAGSGDSVTRWSEAVSEALAANGLPNSKHDINAWLKQIQTESGGNPNAVQHGYTDVNTLSGNLARGLLQVIPPTFREYMFPGHGNITNPYDNILAAINYAKHRYGPRGMYGVIGHGHGYAEGGHVSGYGNTDSVKAMLMPGEFVIRREAARRIGYGTLNQMNNVDRPGRSTAFANGGTVSGGVQHFATGGKVAPPDGKPINNMLKPSGSRMFAWKLIKQLLGVPTTRGMDIPYPDYWGPATSRGFKNHAYTVPELSTITVAKSVTPFLKPLVSWMRGSQSKLPGHTQVEDYKPVSPSNYKSNAYKTRLIQKIMGMKQDGVWGTNMSKNVVAWKKDHGLNTKNQISIYDWKWLAEEGYPDSYGSKRGPHTSSKDKRVRLEDAANRYGMSMWQAAALGKGKNADYVKKHTLAATNKWFLYDAAQMSGSTSWLNGNLIKSYESMFGMPKDGTWSTGMSSWATYAMRKAIGQKTDTIFPPWWTLDPLQKGIEDQDKGNKDQAEFLKDLDLLSSWGFGYLVDKLQSDGVEDGLPVARVAVKNKDLAKQYDDELKTKSDLDSTGTEDFTKFVAAVMAPGVQQGIRSIAQTLGIADFAVVDMYDKLIKSGRLKKGERTSRLDKEVTQFNKGLFYAATGGTVPGTGSGDTVPAMLTPGEFVLRKAAVKAIGLENLYNLNNMDPQHFSTGGQVYSFNDSTGKFSAGLPDLRGIDRTFSSYVKNNSNSNSQGNTDDKTVNNYTTINNPKAERSTASINKLLRKKAALGFMSVNDDKTKVNG